MVNWIYKEQDRIADALERIADELEAHSYLRAAEWLRASEKLTEDDAEEITEFCEDCLDSCSEDSVDDSLEEPEEKDDAEDLDDEDLDEDEDRAVRDFQARVLAVAINASAGNPEALKVAKAMKILLDEVVG